MGKAIPLNFFLGLAIVFFFFFLILLSIGGNFFKDFLLEMTFYNVDFVGKELI